MLMPTVLMGIRSRGYLKESTTKGTSMNLNTTKLIGVFNTSILCVFLFIVLEGEELVLANVEIFAISNGG